MKTRTVDGWRPVRLAPGLEIAVPYEASLEQRDLLALSLDVGGVNVVVDLVAGVLRAVTLTVQAQDGSDLTGTVLRTIPVALIVRRSASLAVQQLTATDVDGFTYRSAGFSLSDERRQEIRSQGPVKESLEVVGRLYGFARAIGERPARFVENELSMPRTTVSKWVRAAREAGLIYEPEVRDGEHSEEA